MEADNSTPSPVHVKLERPASAEPESGSREIKRHVGDTSSVVRTPLAFPWKTCHDLEDVQRLKIKEKAVKQAEEFCKKIGLVLYPVINEAAAKKTDKREAIIMGHKIIKHWLRDYCRTTYTRSFFASHLLTPSQITFDRLRKISRFS